MPGRHPVQDDTNHYLVRVLLRRWVADKLCANDDVDSAGCCNTYEPLPLVLWRVRLLCVRKLTAWDHLWDRDGVR